MPIEVRYDNPEAIGMAAYAAGLAQAQAESNRLAQQAALQAQQQRSQLYAESARQAAQLQAESLRQKAAQDLQASQAKQELENKMKYAQFENDLKGTLSQKQQEQMDKLDNAIQRIDDPDDPEFNKFSPEEKSYLKENFIAKKYNMLNYASYSGIKARGQNAMNVAQANNQARLTAVDKRTASAEKIAADSLDVRKTALAVQTEAKQISLQLQKDKADAALAQSAFAKDASIAMKELESFSKQAQLDISNSDKDLRVAQTEYLAADKAYNSLAAAASDEVKLATNPNLPALAEAARIKAEEAKEKLDIEKKNHAEFSAIKKKELSDKRAEYTLKMEDFRRRKSADAGSVALKSLTDSVLGRLTLRGDRDRTTPTPETHYKGEQPE